MRRKIGSASPARINAAIRLRRRVAGLANQANVECCPGLANGRNIQPGRRPTLTIVEAGLKVVDDFPQAIPVAQRELDVIETYLGAVLDDVLGAPD
jgi:hypothetical protein